MTFNLATDAFQESAKHDFMESVKHEREADAGFSHSVTVVSVFAQVSHGRRMAGPPPAGAAARGPRDEVFTQRAFRWTFVTSGEVYYEILLRYYTTTGNTHPDTGTSTGTMGSISGLLVLDSTTILHDGADYITQRKTYHDDAQTIYYDDIWEVPYTYASFHADLVALYDDALAILTTRAAAGAASLEASPSPTARCYNDAGSIVDGNYDTSTWAYGDYANIGNIGQAYLSGGVGKPGITPGDDPTVLLYAGASAVFFTDSTFAGLDYYAESIVQDYGADGEGPETYSAPVRIEPYSEDEVFIIEPDNFTRINRTLDFDDSDGTHAGMYRPHIAA